MIQYLAWIALAAFTSVGGSMQTASRVLYADFVVNAPVSAVWEAWTTVAGIETFFAPSGEVEPRVDGVYAIYFSPTAAAGRRGADAMRILVFEPPRRLAFTWNAPLDQPYVRGQRTVVTVELEPAADNRTRVRLVHGEWGTGPEWDRAYAYFDAAWNRQVLPRLVWRFEHGPVDWDAPPAGLPPIAATLRATVAYQTATPRE